MEKIITTKDLSLFIKEIDTLLNEWYAKSKGHDIFVDMNIMKLIETLPNENKIETIMMLIAQFPTIRERFALNPGLYGVVYNYVRELNEKRILSISDRDLLLSLQKGTDQVNFNAFLTEKEIHDVFVALKHNMDLYQKLYYDKVFVIESSLGRNEKIAISPKRFFHLMGLDEKDFKTRTYLSEFTNVVGNEEEIKRLLSMNGGIYGVLDVILQKESTIIDAALSGRLNHIFNFPKIKMKNYSFERMGIIEHSTGMIFYDKNLDQSQAAQSSFLQADLFLLNDFIRDYNLDFIFSAYRPYRFSVPSLDAESLFVSQNGENSRFLTGQQSSISQSVGTYHSPSFSYSISQENGTERPNSDPIDYVEFSDEERIKLIDDIIEGLPHLDNEHLIELKQVLSGGGFKK